jgi:glycosyltransferase involved in cell wall biosynthesis
MIALFGRGREWNERNRILRCGIDPEAFKKAYNAADVRREMGLPGGAPVIGHVGAFKAAKNHEFLLQVTKEALKLRPEIRLLLVGDGERMPEISGLAANMGLSQRVLFAGSRRDVSRLMCTCMDVFVFPSLWEGLPVALIEAQAAGLRCSVSDTVTREADLALGALEYLPLAAGAGHWAARAVGAIERGRIPSDQAIRGITERGFSVDTTVSILQELYSEGVRRGERDSKGDRF